MPRIPICAILLLAALPAFAQLPAADLVLWLKADAGITHDADGRVSQWADQSGKGNHFAAADPATQPTLVEKAVGGQPALRFDGVDDALAITTAPLPVAGRTVFAVVKWNEARIYSFALGCADGTDGYLRLHSTTSLLTGGHYPVLFQNAVASPKVGYAPGDGRQIFHNELQSLLQWNVYAIPETANAKERLKYLGRNEANNTPENRFKGEIAEVIVFDRILPLAERAQVEQYLGAKYLGWPTMATVPVRDEGAEPRPVDAVPGAAVPVRLIGVERVLAHGMTDRPLAAGRYQVRFRMQSNARCPDRFKVRFGGHVRAFPVEPGAVPRTEYAADFVVPVGQPAETMLARVTWRGIAASGVAEPSHASVTDLCVWALAPVVVRDVQVDKVLYAPGQAAVGTVTVRNFAAEAQRIEVRCFEVTGLDDRRPVGTQPADVPAGGGVTLHVAYNVGVVEYGRELWVEAWQDGKRRAVGREPYSVADNVWKVALGSTSGGPIGTAADYSLETIAEQLRQARRQYSNWFEKTFWAPDDWGVLTTPPGATWYSGQARRHENTEKLQFQIKTAHDLGMKAVTYGKCMAGGLPGWELARQRPQWFSVDAYGRTMGRPADVWDLDHWQEGDKYKYRDYKYDWTYRWVDLRRLDTLDYGIDQLIASTRQFGWDGVRYDSGGFRAHFVPKDGKVYYDGVDSFNARNMRRTKERIWQESPGFIFGYNTNDPVCDAATKVSAPLTPTDPAGHEFREMMAGGGLWMFEGMRDKPDFWGRRTYKTWSDYATDMVQAIRTIRGYGGHVCFSYGDTELYKFMIGTMIGAHDYVGERLRAGGSEDWGRFLTRWSSFVWDHRLRALPDESKVAVTAARPLWWKGFANELVVSRTQRYVIIHLMNPPVHDECAKTKDELPAPVEGITVALKHPGEELVRATFIAPGAPNREWSLSPQRDNSGWGVSQFALPRLDVWGMVVVELKRGMMSRGNRVPKALPALTEPLSAAELAEMEQCKPTPNVPIADNLLNPTPQFDAAKATVKDFGVPKATMPAGLQVGGEPGLDVLVVKGLYHYSYRVPEALKVAAPPARLTECTTRDLPKDYAALFRYDVVVLVNMGADAWDADGHRRLADFVDAGGRLVVLGGVFTLGQGFYKGTALEQVLPVSVRQARDVYQLPKPLALGAQKSVAFAGQPLLYFYHAVEPRADARVRLWAGDLPVCYERTVGKGSACVFVGTTMGEGGAAGQQPFWTWEGWPAVLGELILGAKP